MIIVLSFVFTHRVLVTSKFFEKHPGNLVGLLLLTSSGK
jgi:hypothetical protein